jgi:hypothetical protein
MDNKNRRPALFKKHGSRTPMPIKSYNDMESHMDMQIPNMEQTQNRNRLYNSSRRISNNTDAHIDFFIEKEK